MTKDLHARPRGSGLVGVVASQDLTQPLVRLLAVEREGERAGNRFGVSGLAAVEPVAEQRHVPGAMARRSLVSGGRPAGRRK
jgi:hypothetical protein